MLRNVVVSRYFSEKFDSVFCPPDYEQCRLGHSIKVLLVTKQITMYSDYFKIVVYYLLRCTYFLLDLFCVCVCVGGG